MERKWSERARGSPRRPSPESSNDRQPGTSNSPGLQGRHIINSLEDSVAFLWQVREYFKDADPGKFDAFTKLLVSLKRAGVGSPCAVSQVKELFRGHTYMLKRFNDIFHPDLKILIKEDVPEIQDLAKLYVAKVKKRSSPSEYTTFMHILYLYNECALTTDEVDREVEVLFAKSCDLLEEYADCIRPDRAAPVVQSPLHPRHSALEVSELEREQQSERLRRMCEKVAKRKRKAKGKGVVTEREHQLPLKRVSALLSNAANNALGTRRSTRSSVQAHPRRPARSSVGATPAPKTQSRSRSRSWGSENAENYGRSMCTPNYLLLKPRKNGDGDGEDKCEVSVHRSELAKSVLNEECELVVRVTNFKRRTRNPHEEVLFTCETDQCEYDLIIKRLESTAKTFMNYLLKLQKLNIGEVPSMKELLLPMHKRSIQQLYHDDAQIVMATLEENPARALPILLHQLILKLEELKSDKAMLIPIWSKTYKNNFHLSLEHQSTDYKSKVKSKIRFKNINDF